MAVDSKLFAWRALFASANGPPHPLTRLVLFVISDYMDGDGEDSYPSHATIAERCGLSEKWVRVQLAHAERAGWVAISKRPVHNSKNPRARFVNQYRPTVPEHLELLIPEWKSNGTYETP